MSSWPLQSCVLFTSVIWRMLRFSISLLRSSASSISNRILELHDSTTIPPSPFPSLHLYLTWHDSIICCKMWWISLFIQFCRIWIRITVTSREVAGDGGSQRGDSSPSMKINDDGARMETELEVVCTWLGFNLLLFIYYNLSWAASHQRNDETKLLLLSLLIDLLFHSQHTTWCAYFVAVRTQHVCSYLV